MKCYDSSNDVVDPRISAKSSLALVWLRSSENSLHFLRGLQADLDIEIQKLKDCKAVLDGAVKAFQDVTGKSSGADREAYRREVTNTLERRMFYVPSFKIYGGVAGFYDYGPPGCALKSNFISAWRQHFVVEENMLEVECPAVTPIQVLKASGHVDRFQDYMVSDLETHVRICPP